LSIRLHKYNNFNAFVILKRLGLGAYTFAETLIIAQNLGKQTYTLSFQSCA